MALRDGGSLAEKEARNIPKKMFSFTNWLLVGLWDFGVFFVVFKRKAKLAIYHCLSNRTKESSLRKRLTVTRQRGAWS